MGGGGLLLWKGDKGDCKWYWLGGWWVLVSSVGFWSIGLCVRAAERTKRVEMEEVATKACTCVCVTGWEEGE